MRVKFFVPLVAVFGLAFGATAGAVQGPVQTPLKVTAIYMADANGAVYVQFQPGSMPGCYNTGGGYLLPGNTFFKELYAKLLTIVASGGIRGAVIYTQNASTNNWGDCTINGIYLLPD